MPHNNQILISGASIAGLTLAHWLSRHGFQPTVIERAPTLRDGGNGVDVRDQAIEVADRMGILEQIRQAACDVVGMRFVNTDDESVATIDTRVEGAVEIMRGDLVALLHQVAGNNVEYIFNDSITSLKQDKDGVDVTFENTPARRFDLVVGADGLHSTVRRLAFGPESQFLKYKDHYFAFANADAALGADRWVTMYNLPGKMAGLYRSGNHPQAKAYFVYHRKEQITYDYRDIDQHKRLISEVFAAETSWRIGELLETALADPDFYFDALSQVQMESWSSGRVTLVGDAAYCASPASGAGAELALLGAYRLAGELAAAGGDHELAFPKYQQSHSKLVKQKQKIGPNVGLIVPRTRIGRLMRDTLVRLPLMPVMALAARLVTPKTPKPLTNYPVTSPAAG